MKRARILALVLAMCIATALLAGCGSEKPAVVPTQVPTQVPTEAATVATTEGEPVNPHAATDGGVAAMKEVFRLISKENVVCLNGLRPPEFKDRSQVDKALPVEQKEDLHIGFVQVLQSSVFFQTMYATVLRYADERGWKVEYNCANADQEVMNQTIRAYISMGVDVIFANCNIPMTSPLFTEAVEAGIPVVSTGATLAKTEFNLITEFITSAYSAGWKTGVYSAEHDYEVGETPIVGIILNSIGGGDTDSRTCGFIGGYTYAKAKMDGVPYGSQWDCILDSYNIWQSIVNGGKYSDEVNGIEYVGYGNGGSPTVDGGTKAAQDLVVAHPEITLLFVETDNMYPGVRVILEQNNLLPGKDLTVACAADATKFGMEYLKSGEVLCIGNNSSETYSLAAMTLIDDIFTRGFDANNLLENTYMPVALVTAENVDQFYDPSRDLAKGSLEGKYLYTVTEWNEAHSGTEDSAPDPFDS